MDSKTGLIIQFTGIFLIAVLSLLLRRSLTTRALNYWTAGWASLSLSLFFLSCAFGYGQFLKLFFSFYFLFEYLFGFLLIFGCYSLSGDFKIRNRHKLIFIPFLLMAFILPWLSTDISLIFNIHALVFALFFAAGYFVLKNTLSQSFGLRVMKIALVLLALNFFHYFVVFTLLQLDIQSPLPADYMAYSSMIDLILEIQLGFGMVIILLEQVLQDARTANEKLLEAHQKLEQIAQTDSLTEAFNRHAFHGFLKKRGEDEKTISGCVGFFDIDDLKPLNDRYGHSVGDIAIRHVVGSIRKLLRAEDLIFRWGGDEFFVIMVSMEAKMARARMKELEILLTGIVIDDAQEPLSIGVSFGFMDFADVSALETAIKLADEEMYRQKQLRKQSKTGRLNIAPLQPEHQFNLGI